MPATLNHTSRTDSASAPNYEDGPDVSRNDGSDPIEVERAYRQAFRAVVHEIAEWRAPDYAARLKAVTHREEARDNARTIRVGEVAYRCNHAVAAARLRAGAQAFDSATKEWWRLHREGLSHEDIARSVVPRWKQAVDAWAGELDMTGADRPPFIGDVISEGDVERLRSGADGDGPLVLSVRELLNNHPDLRVPVIEGLIRRGETMNVIAPPKTGKSWLVLDLAIAVATGRPWLERFETHQGNVLLIDNELHPETTANRVPKVAGARGVPIEAIADTLDVASLRGGLQDIVSFGAYFDALEPGRYRVIVLDAWYRFMPADTDENDNGTMASLYNRLDHHAARLGCSFVLIHHATKGSQASKAITDVGAGAQSRATDTHLVLRAHEETDVIVLDAAV